MTITESQRRTLDLMAESAGWSWADVEHMSQLMFRECVAGLTKGQANLMMFYLGPDSALDDDEVAAMEHDCDKEYRADCARCNGVSPMDAGCW